MKVLIVTVGTRGDIQPYIGLSQMLTNAGHSATIGSSKAHENLIRGFDVDFLCIDETEDTSLIQDVIRSKGLKAIHEGLRLLFDGMFKCHERILEAVNRFDLIIGHGWIGEVESEMCGKRFIRVGISPNIAEKVKSQATSLGEKLGVDVERLALNRMIIEPYNEFRRKVDYSITNLESIYAKPLFLPISKVLLGSMKLWNKRTYQSSYWYANYGDRSLPDNVTRLLSNGRKTVLVNFGSMTSGLKIENSFIADFYKVAHQMDCNLMWIGKHSFDDEYLHSDRFVAVEEIPLVHVLPKVDIVFHHCGLGTTSEVIRSGCPSVPVPFVIDQHEWAKRLMATGAAAATIRLDQLTEKHIRKRLDSVFKDEKYKINADLIKNTVLQEIKADETVQRIEEICEV